MRKSAWQRAFQAERPLPLYQAIAEEFGRLHPGEADASLRSSPQWEFTAEQILDPQDFARIFREARSELDQTESTRSQDEITQYIVARGTILYGALDSYSRKQCPPDGPAADAFRLAVAERLNELVHGEGLYKVECFHSIRLNPYATELWEQGDDLDAAQRREAHRLVLEAAYPTQLKRIRDLQLDRAFDRIHEKSHAALCFSGGGIRSAAFGLGVVQGLAREKILGAFHYLSTVSGGGYLGGWLSAWMAHAGPASVEADLTKDPSTRLQPEPAPIQYLRAYSNYLSPRLGFFSADTWTLLATYVRNLLLNWLVLLPPLAAVVIVPWLCVAVVGVQPGDFDPTGVLYALWWLALIGGLVSGSFAVSFVHRNRPSLSARAAKPTEWRSRTQTAFLKRCLTPMVLSAVLLTTAWKTWWYWHCTGVPDCGAHDRLLGSFALAGAGLHFLGWLMAVRLRVVKRLPEGIVIAVSGAIVGTIAYAIARALIAIDDSNLYVALALPAFLTILLIGGQLFIGLASRWTNDPEREWGARFNAWILIVAVGWLAFSSVILFGPRLVERLFLLAVGSISGVLTVFLGRSAATSGAPPKADAKSKGNAPVADKGAGWRGWALALAAPVFAVSIMILLSAGDAWLIHVACGRWPNLCRLGAEGASTLRGAALARPAIVVAVGLALLAVGGLFGGFVDTNKFSLHAMYRARLIRAFLGASRPGGERRPDPFTGFDEADDLGLSRLWPSTTAESVGPGTPPLHVINLSLNLVHGESLAWQERKAEPFSMSPLHAGSAFVGYRRTSALPPVPLVTPSTSSPTPERFYGSGISLGTAVTISGAAASPNAGYHSSPIVTFLMTIFNARLGAWLGNPGPAGRSTYYLPAPRFHFVPIIQELFGLTDDRNKYVYLSDGGHFENLALYEMVLRRCKYIVVSDAGSDPDCAFEDLGNAIRKIRIDLGVPIEFPHEPAIYPRGATKLQEYGRYWAAGTIRYSAVDKPKLGGDGKPLSNDGILIYLKPAFYGLTEPMDVYNYARVHEHFPHESTVDQFYSESQFESYRALGSHVVSELFAAITKSAPVGGGEASRGTDPLAWLAQRAWDLENRPRPDRPNHTVDGK